LFSSVIGSEQLPPQLFCVALQHATPVPVVGGLHDVPVVQLFAHVPQCASSARSLH
jgi:hypothetical protein